MRFQRNKPFSFWRGCNGTANLQPISDHFSRQSFRRSLISLQTKPGETERFNRVKTSVSVNYNKDCDFALGLGLRYRI